MYTPFDAVATMVDLGFDLAIIEEVKAALDEGQEQVGAAAKLKAVGGTSFGDLPEGLDLADHTQRARDKVAAALEDMVAGLAGYRSAVVHLVEETFAVEQDTAGALTKIQQSSDCLTAPSFSAPGQCTAPTAEEQR